MQGFSVGRYESNALLVETTHYVFDITGFDDYNGIPSSQQKKVTERYWRDGEQLKATVTVADPMFLQEADLVHDAMAAGAEGLQAEGLRLRCRSGTAVGAVHPAE